MIEMSGKYTTAKIMIDDVDSGCISMIQNILSHPACTNPVAIMPDTHLGKGIVIGFTMPLSNKIVPNWVGVDIGCGVRVVSIPDCYDMENLNFEELDKRIRKSIPLGTNINKTECSDQDIQLLCDLTNDAYRSFKVSYEKLYDVILPDYRADLLWFENLCKRISTLTHQVRCSLGSLGGGNHYLEIGKSEQEYGNVKYWASVHSGSRNFGLKIANYHQNKAKEALENKRKMVENEIKTKILNDPSNIRERDSLIKDLKKKFDNDPSVDLRNSEYLDGTDMYEYIFDMIFAQAFSVLNRKKMTDVILRCISEMTGKVSIGSIPRVIESIHNYIDFEDLVIRKGAISSHSENISIIPLNMRDGSLITIGKSNPEWNYSAPHGAGRIHSRTKAKELLKLEDFEKEMEGIFSTSVRESTLDESPMAYKDMNFIIDSIEPTCEIVDRIIPIYNLKA